MQRRWQFGLMSLVSVLVVVVAQAAPIPAGQLMMRRAMTLSGSGNFYNPRICNGEVFAVKIASPYTIGRFLDGSTTPDVTVRNDFDVRMMSPMGGGTNQTYVIGAGGNDNDYFSRFDYGTLSNSVQDTSLAIRVNTFAWVDEDTVVASSYHSDYRNRLYLLDITADPFAVSLNTAWNENGYVVTPIENRIRSVTVGDVYSGYAYFSDDASLTNKICALDLADGTVTELGTYMRVDGDSYGSWTVKESGGYLYIQTAADGIHVYSMTDATTLGSLVVHHTQAQLDAVTDITTGSYGFDVVDGGLRMLLVRGTEYVAELVQDLPFTDDFESYDQADVPLNRLGYRGWGASSNSVAVTAAVGVSGSKAICLAGETSLTNTSYTSVTVTRVWTDMQLQPVQIGGNGYPQVDTNATAMLYVNADGYVVVYDPSLSDWSVCSNNVTGWPVDPIASNTYVRISLFQNYDAGTVSVFADNVLLCENLTLISSQTKYKEIVIQNTSETPAYLDDVWISTNYPATLTGDIDNNGWVDANEIEKFGSLWAATNGVPCTWLDTYELTDPDGDADGDDFTNAEEYAAGTNPTDDTSVFQILSIEQVGATVKLTVMGNDSGASTQYWIERSTNLVEGFPIDLVEYADRGQAPGNTVYVDENPPSDAVFYRIYASEVE